VGTRPEERYTGLLEEKVCEQAGVEPTLRAPPSLDAVRRKTEDASFLFLLNHGEKTVEVSLPGPGRDLLTGEEHDSTLVLGPLEASVSRLRRTDWRWARDRAQSAASDLRRRLQPRAVARRSLGGGGPPDVLRESPKGSSGTL
jgi:hypothetical protein